MKKVKINKTLLWMAIIWLIIVVISLKLSPAIRTFSDFIMVFTFYGIPAFILILIILIKWIRNKFKF